MPGRLPLTFALEAVECSNRCRHCETSYGPRRRYLSREKIRAWAEEVRMAAARAGIQATVTLNNSEVLDHPEWREVLHDLGEERLGRAFATNGRQIAREPSIVTELRARGVEWLQLTLAGGSAKVHDWFTRRPGSFDDIGRAAEAAQAAGMHVSWVYLVYRPIEEVTGMAAVAAAISGRYQAEAYAHRGGVDQTLFLIKPQGEGAKLEDRRPTRTDLDLLPTHLGPDRFSQSYGAGCETEAELVEALCSSERRIGCLGMGLPGGLASCVVCRNGDVYPYCHERRPAFLLGNLHGDGGMAWVRDALFGEGAPFAVAIRRRGLAELAAAYGDHTSDRLHSGCSLCRTLVARALRRELE